MIFTKIVNIPTQRYDEKLVSYKKISTWCIQDAHIIKTTTWKETWASRNIAKYNHMNSRFNPTWREKRKEISHRVCTAAARLVIPHNISYPEYLIFNRTNRNMDALNKILIAVVTFHTHTHDQGLFIRHLNSQNVHCKKGTTQL